jgi:hypothetical protein
MAEILVESESPLRRGEGFQIIFPAFPSLAGEAGVLFWPHMSLPNLSD